MKIFPQTMTECVNYGGDCRTAPATPGLLKIEKFYKLIYMSKFESSCYDNKPKNQRLGTTIQSC